MTGKEKLCHVVHSDCKSFYLLKYCLVICRILGILQITYLIFTLIPDLEFLFRRKTLALPAALRPDLALERRLHKRSH